VTCSGEGVSVVVERDEIRTAHSDSTANVWLFLNAGFRVTSLAWQAELPPPSAAAVLHDQLLLFHSLNIYLQCFYSKAVYLI